MKNQRKKRNNKTKQKYGTLQGVDEPNVPPFVFLFEELEWRSKRRLTVTTTPRKINIYLRLAIPVPCPENDVWQWGRWILISNLGFSVNDKQTVTALHIIHVPNTGRAQFLFYPFPWLCSASWISSLFLDHHWFSINNHHRISCSQTFRRNKSNWFSVRARASC